MTAYPFASDARSTRNLPHTFYVLAALMLFLGGSAILVTPKDILPAIKIPVVTVIWQYTGLAPEELSSSMSHPFRFYNLASAPTR